MKINWPVSFILIFFLCSCISHNQHSKPLVVGSNNWLGYQPLYYGVQKEIISKNNIILSEFTSTSKVTEALIEGSLDIAAVTIDEAIRINSKIDITIFLITDISNGADVILGMENVKAMQDLRGKKVGFEKSALGHYFLKRALENSNISFNEIHPIPVEFDEHKSSFLTNKVDVIVTFEPIRSELLKEGANLIFDSSQIPNEILDVLVVRTDVLKKEKKKLQEITSQWFKVLDDIKLKSKDFEYFLTDQIKMKQSDIKNALETIKFPTKEQSKFIFDKEIEKISNQLNENMIQLEIVNQKEKLKFMFLSN